jgi:predicted dithiol-disulfide oxidoreductase (DUF899 family)
MTVPRIVSAEDWLAERKELRAAEEQAAEALAQYLDLTPLGRQDADVELLHHDKYPAAEAAAD